MLTQIASGFIGDVTDDFVIEKLSGTYSRYGNVIHFTDGKDDKILSIATAKDVTDNVHRKSLKDNVETFDVELIGERNYDEHIIKGNRIIIPGEDGMEYIEFTIDEISDKREQGKGFELYSYASYLDLSKAKAIESFTFTGTAQQHLGRALFDTEYETGVVESDREITISFENWTNPYEYARRVAREFELELDFEIFHDGLLVRNRYVNLVDRVGAWRGREITFGKDLKSITRKESGDVYTALIGIGPEREDGSRLQVLVEDDEALERWGRPKHDPQHLIGVYEPQSERDEMTQSELRQYTTTELNKRVALVDYEIDFLDLEYILGHDDKKIRFGDTIRIKDTLYTPNLYLEARIFEMKRNVIVPDQKEYVLGDFVEYDAETIHDLYKYVRREMSKKAGIDLLLNYAEPKKVESDTAPEIKEGENPVWIDTSKTPKVPYVVVAGQWQKMSPTTPEEVNAYNKQQVDDKAEQALVDAKAFAENADNINSGVIDVGAIPLRTSITGARLEWDGVNGLVQYDMQGNPVSWLDLDANAHFANAFLSGRIEALEGYFGDNMSLVDGKLQITRPDGAVWMQGGLVNQDYAITGYDPYFMDEIQNPSGRFPAFQSGLSGGGSFYTGSTDVIDGTGDYSVDIRDSSKGYTVNFQRYQFIHSARYFVLRLQISSRTNGLDQIRARLYEGDTNRYNITITNFGSWDALIVDLGVPTYEQKNVDFRLGFLKQWKRSGADGIAFRISRIFLTDFI